MSASLRPGIPANRRQRMQCFVTVFSIVESYVKIMNRIETNQKQNCFKSNIGFEDLSIVTPHRFSLFPFFSALLSNEQPESFQPNSSEKLIPSYKKAGGQKKLPAHFIIAIDAIFYLLHWPIYWSNSSNNSLQFICHSPYLFPSLNFI